MLLRSPQSSSGLPAAFCRRYETAVNLQSLIEALGTTRHALAWLDSARQHPSTGRYSILGWDPWLVVESSGSRSTISTSSSTVQQAGSPLDVLQEVLRRYPGPRGAGLPPVGLGWIVVLGYELNRWVERLPPPKALEDPAPELLLMGMCLLVVVDHVQDRSWCVSVVDPHQPQARAIRQAHERLERVHEHLRPAASTPTGVTRRPVTSPSTVEPTMSQAAFEAMVHAAQAYISAGEIFQANLAQRFLASWHGSPWELYLTLRAINPSPFACFLQDQNRAIVSCSPERLVRVRDGLAEARPIAGTRPRGRNPEEDVVNSLELILSDKERAEHIMLVDLARNDLGRVCRYGTVQVDELMVLEEYSHVIHIVSNVRGVLQERTDAVDVIRAMFPGGTITGCPKVRCMEIIRELEPVARGLYTGSCGSIGFDGSMDLNILIRTMAVQHDRLTFHVGAGIVADSQPDHEYHETLAKAGALMSALRQTAPQIPQDALVH